MVWRKIDTRIWGDARFKRLSPMPPSGQSLWLWLLTNDQTGPIPGLYSVGEAAAAEMLGWSLEAFREAFREAFQEGLVEADWKARLIWIPNAVKYNSPASPNVVLSWADSWSSLPECDLKDKAHQELKAFMKGLGEAFREAFAKALPEGFGESRERERAGERAGAGAGEKNSCSELLEYEGSEPADSAPPPLLVFPVVGRGPKTWGLARELLEEFAESYPGVDVLAEAKAARSWCLANAAKRKTHRGMPAFLNRWMQRAQNDGRKNGHPPRAAPPVNNEPKGYAGMRQLAQAGGFDDGDEG